MYQLILSDLDETLLVNHHVPQVNQEAIARLPKETKFVVATGRAYNMIGEILKEVGTYQKENEYAICFNGGLIVENKDNRILHFQGLEFELVEKLFEESKKYDVCVLIFTLDCCYIFHADPDEVQRKIDQKARFEVHEEDNIDFLKNEKIAKILYERRDMDYLKHIASELSCYEEKVSISFSSYRYLEMNAKGVCKGNALLWLADYLHIPTCETIAIGDNYNDESMIKEAGLGVCVSSAVKDIQEIADYTTQLDFDEGAVKEVIEKFVLEEEK